jgi:hypothetical protein
MLHKVTRVWTQQLALTTSKEEAARSLHAPLWAHVVSRGIVADYHTQGVESFGGAARNQLDEQGTMSFTFICSTLMVSVAHVSGVARLVLQECTCCPRSGTARWMRSTPW